MIARPRRRQGFSLIELLINLAIISALVGIALPFYQGYTYQTQSSKARYDIATLRNAIQRFDQFSGRLTGSSLDPLLGTYLQELPTDPWANEYVLDGSLAILGTLGSDGIPDGEDSDQDILVQYVKYLTPVKASYEGPFGPPKAENVLTLRFSRPFGIVAGMLADVPWDIVLVPDPASPGIPLYNLGFQVDGSATNPAEGLLGLRCVNPALNFSRTPVRADDLVNLAPLVLSITEVAEAGGPIDEVAFYYMHGPVPAESGLGSSGLRLQRGPP